MFQVGPEVIEILDTDAEPYQSVIDSARLANLRGNARVSHARGVPDQRFDATKALGKAEELCLG